MSVHIPELFRSFGLHLDDMDMIEYFDRVFGEGAIYRMEQVDRQEMTKLFRRVMGSQTPAVRRTIHDALEVTSPAASATNGKTEGQVGQGGHKLRLQDMKGTESLMRQAFARYDMDGSGGLTKQELG